MTSFRTSAIAAILCVLISISVWAKDPIPTPKDSSMMGQLDPYLLKSLYPSRDPDGSLADIVDKDGFQALIKKHKLSLFGGPMLGCVTDHSARFWVRTPGAATVQVVVGKTGN